MDVDSFLCQAQEIEILLFFSSYPVSYPHTAESHSLFVERGEALIGC